jgi:putative ABC transport system ATP-binding protein
MNDPDVIIEVRGLRKAFEKGNIPALDGTDLTVRRGEFVAVIGPSGCGKSTLLHLIAALDHPDTGTIRVEGQALTEMRDLSVYRASKVGLVFQFHNLLPSLSAEENVQVPMIEINMSRRARRDRARALLAEVGLTGKEHHRPTELSGGERQRVAVARSLANDPLILLADEPTGNLDSASSGMVLDLLVRLRQERNLTVVLVTHDLSVAGRADRIVRMLDGRVVGEERPLHLEARAGEAAQSVPVPVSAAG